MAQGDGLFWVANKAKAARQIYRAIKRKNCCLHHQAMGIHWTIASSFT